MNCVRCCRFRKPDEQTLHSGMHFEGNTVVIRITFPRLVRHISYLTSDTQLQTEEYPPKYSLHSYSSYSNILENYHLLRTCGYKHTRTL